MRKKYTSLFIFYLSVWMLFFLIAISYVLPENPVKFPDKLTSTVTEFFPQGWGFFSKDPRDEYFYVVNLGTEQIEVSWPNMTLDNFLGLSRFGRSQGIELGRIYAQVGEETMIECDKTPVECLKEQESINITNDSPSPTVIGDIGIVKQEPVPWAWAKSVELEDMPSKTVRLQVDVPRDE